MKLMVRSRSTVMRLICDTPGRRLGFMVYPHHVDRALAPERRSAQVNQWHSRWANGSAPQGRCGCLIPGTCGSMGMRGHAASSTRWTENYHERSDQAAGLRLTDNDRARLRKLVRLRRRH